MIYKIKGYACIYNYVDDGGDLIAETALDDNPLFAHPERVKMLYQHDITRPIGRWTFFRNDQHGLYAEGEIMTTINDGFLSSELLDKKIIDGLSIGFIAGQSYVNNKNVRILEHIDLREISLVTFPMQDIARIFTTPAEDDFEHFLSAFNMRITKMTSH